MAVYRSFRNQAFEPEAIATMSSAYDDVCRELGLEDRDQLQANAVAKKIIEFAQRGERDPVRLRLSVLPRPFSASQVLLRRPKTGPDGKFQALLRAVNNNITAAGNVRPGMAFR